MEPSFKMLMKINIWTGEANCVSVSSQQGSKGQYSQILEDPTHECPLLLLSENCTLCTRDPSHTRQQTLKNLYEKPQTEASAPPTH